MTRARLSDKIGQFVSIPFTVVKMIPVIGSDATALFVYMRYRTNQKSGNTFPSYNTIQKDTNLSRRRIARAIRALMDAGLVERKRRFGKSTIYTLLMPAKPISITIATNGKTSISNNPATDISNDAETIISTPVDTLTRLNELEQIDEEDISEDEPEPVDPSVTPGYELQFNQALNEVKYASHKTTWDRYESMKLISVNGTWKVLVPRLNYAWISSRYVDGTLNRILKAMTGETVKVEFVIGGGK